MSRSFHVTRRQLERELSADYAHGEVSDERIARSRRDLDRKRLAKELVHEERRETPPLVHATPDAIPIHVVEAGEHIAYPASPDDLREIMRLLPAGILDGLAAVELSLGRHHEEDYEEPDPFVGRRSTEFVPGAWRIGVAGTYSPDSAKIRLFGLVFDPECATRRLLEPYLRARMLLTFVHEVAHHQDHATRVARGRWRADDDERLEVYAELRVHEWQRDIVIPYMRRQDPEGIERLFGWIERHGGVAVTLPTLLGDPRWRMRPMQAFFSFGRRSKPWSPTSVARPTRSRPGWRSPSRSAGASTSTRRSRSSTVCSPSGRGTIARCWSAARCSLLRSGCRTPRASRGR